MAKFHGTVGYAQTEETSPGVHVEVVTEREYRGDLLRNTRLVENNEDGLNTNININNRFSIVADAYAYANFQFIRYITWNGAKWRVGSVDIDRPRIILTVRGVYNG